MHPIPNPNPKPCTRILALRVGCLEPPGPSENQRNSAPTEQELRPLPPRACCRRGLHSLDEAEAQMRSKSDARPLRGPARLAQMAAADPGAPGCRGRWGLGLREAFAALVPAAISDSAGTNSWHEEAEGSLQCAAVECELRAKQCTLHSMLQQAA